MVYSRAVAARADQDGMGATGARPPLTVRKALREKARLESVSTLQSLANLDGGMRRDSGVPMASNGRRTVNR